MMKVSYANCHEYINILGIVKFRCSRNMNIIKLAVIDGKSASDLHVEHRYWRVTKLDMLLSKDQFSYLLSSNRETSYYLVRINSYLGYPGCPEINLMKDER